MMLMAAEARRRLEEHLAALQGAAEPNPEAAGELAETRAALERIAGGSYGWCEGCGGAIGRQRLLALPAARFCVTCAGRH